ncbi:hypothetical protein [Labrys sp. (in: a-proteobacteria)]|uniref:hypothetical protein n=1 Tax=Labrys sp. (in: a-proteobacteria) TaxID=1917972 RepID=UPI0039E4C981
MSEDRALQPPGDRPALVLLFHLAFSLLGIALASLMAALVYVSAAALQGGKFFPLELQESFPAATPVTSLAALTAMFAVIPALLTRGAAQLIGWRSPWLYMAAAAVFAVATYFEMARTAELLAEDPRLAMDATAFVALGAACGLVFWLVAVRLPAGLAKR